MTELTNDLHTENYTGIRDLITDDYVMHAHNMDPIRGKDGTYIINTSLPISELNQISMET